MLPRSRTIAATAAALSLWALALASAAADVKLPPRDEVEAALPEGGSLTGREIFDRFLDNRMHSAVQ